MKELFSQGQSWVHRWPVTYKLPIALFFIMLVSSIQDLHTGLAALSISFVLLLNCRLPFNILAKRIILVNGFTLFIWLTLPFTYKTGHQWLAYSPEGLRITLLITIRTNAAVFFMISLLGTASITELVFAMHRWKIPEKLSLLFLFSYRYLFLLYDEYLRLKRSISLRGFVPGNNRHTYKTFGSLLGMTLVKSWNRAARVEQAMALRGYQGKLPVQESFNLSWKPFLLSAGSLLIGSVLIYMEWRLHYAS